MRHLMTASLLLALLGLAACGGNGGGDQAPLTELEDGVQRMSYALGMDLALQVGDMPGAEDHEALMSGVREKLADESRLDAMEARNLLQQHAAGATDTTGEFSDPDFADRTEQRSYAVGVTVADFVAMQFDTVDTRALIQGLRDQMGEGETLVSPDSTRAVITRFQEARQQAVSESNVTEGEAFLAENAERPEVQVTDSGLQYLVLEKGDGPTPEATDRVTVHYRGTLLDGTEFDSSYARGEPATFPLNGVIAGWTEGLQLMPVGSKYKFFVPSELAYGERGAGGRIGPNATLIFEVELLEIAE